MECSIGLDREHNFYRVVVMFSHGSNGRVYEHHRLHETGH